jgi:hypothetical protein
MTTIQLSKAKPTGRFWNNGSIHSKLQNSPAKGSVMGHLPIGWRIIVEQTLNSNPATDGLPDDRWPRLGNEKTAAN